MPTRRGLVLGLAALAAGGMARVSRAQAPGLTLFDIEAWSGGRLGVAILDTGTGKSVGHRVGERFPLCSTAKVLICGAALARVDIGQDSLARRIAFSSADIVANSPVTQPAAGGEGLTLATLCEAAMTRSDNTAANLIMASLGGPEAVTAFLRTIGDTVTRLDRTEPALNQAAPGDERDTTTPAAMAATLQRLVLGEVLTRQSRALLTAWLLTSQTGAERLRAGLPKPWRVGSRTGSGGQGTTNDVAVVWPPHRVPLVVCAFLTGTAAKPAARDAILADVGRAVPGLLAGAGEGGQD